MSAEANMASRSRLRTAVLAAAAFAAAQAAATPASAGLLDFLFGRPQPQPVMVAPVEPPKPTRRVFRDEPSGPRTYVPPEVVPGPLGRFLRDPSLRRGDVVATPNGLMVFQGQGGSSNHRPSDFVPVANAGSVSGARRSDLITLDRTLRSPPALVDFVVAKPEPKAVVIARADGEPRGGFISPPGTFEAKAVESAPEDLPQAARLD